MNPLLELIPPTITATARIAAAGRTTTADERDCTPYPSEVYAPLWRKVRESLRVMLDSFGDHPW